METEDNNNKLLLPFPENELQEYIHSMDILKMNGEILRIQIIMDEENKEMNPYDIMRGVMTIYYGQKVTWFYHRKGDIVRKKIGELHKTNLFVDWKNRQCIYDVESKQWHYYGEFGQHFTSDEITIFCLNQRPSRQISINEEDCYIVVSDGAVFREHTKGRYILTGYNKSYNKPTPKSCQNY